jgi:hypothetical protein
MLSAVLPCGGARAAEGLASLSVIAPVMECAAVAQLDLSGATDAPVMIQSAAVVTAGAPAPYCAVQGTIAPANVVLITFWESRICSDEASRWCVPEAAPFTG